MGAAILVAAGTGSRLGGVKKQFLPLGDGTVLERSISIFSGCDAVEQIVIVTAKEDVATLQQKHYPKVTAVVEGGNTRAQSVQNGFYACAKTDFIAIHDAARPFVSMEDVNRVIADAEQYGAAVLGVPAKDTIKEAQNQMVQRTLPRENLYMVQTPQVFSYALFARAVASVDPDLALTDDSQLIEQLGEPVYITVGDENNFKITTQQDLTLIKLIEEERK